MKKLYLLFALACLFLAHSSFSQSTEDSYVDLGVGVGPNYGITGFKSVIGKNGSGLMVGIGSFDGFTTFSIGAQARSKWWFVNASYAAFGSYEFSGIFQEKGLLNGLVVITGGQINLVNNKLFLELGIGFHGGSNVTFPVTGEKVDSGGLSLGAGIGYRI